MVIAGLQVAITALTQYPGGTTATGYVWLAVTLWLLYLIYREKVIAWELLTGLSITASGLVTLAAFGLATFAPQVRGWWVMSLVTSLATVIMLVSPTVRSARWSRPSQCGWYSASE
jgi:hypothetical protein